MMKPFTMRVFAEDLKDCTWEQKAISVASHFSSAAPFAARATPLPV